MAKLSSIERQKKYQAKLRVEKKLKKNEEMFIKKFQKKQEEITKLYGRLTEDALEKTRLKYERKMEKRLEREKRKLEKNKMNKKRKIKGKEVIEDKTITLRKKKLDTVFSKYIRLRDKNICFCCGKTTNPTCGHLFSRVANATRFDELNCHCQCLGCNLEHENNPHKYANKFKKIYGQEEYDRLWQLRNTTIKYNIQRYKDKIREYNEKINKLSNIKQS